MFYDHDQSAYLAEHLPMPADLTGIRAHIRKLCDQIRSRRLARVRSDALSSTSPLAGASRPLAGLHTGDVDAGQVKRGEKGILAHLENLVAPERAADARHLIVDHLGMTELDETASATAELNADLPEVVGALLELKVVRARKLFDQALAARSSLEADADGADWTLLDYLFEEYDRIRIAYLLRRYAERCAAQIASPTGWPPLDRLDGSDNVRVGTVSKRLLADLALVERAIELYDQGRRPAGGLLAHNVLVSTDGMTVNFAGIGLSVSERDVKKFNKLGLDERACAQLAIWKSVHGDALPVVLENTIHYIRGEIATLRTRLEARVRADHHNNVLGNIGHCNAGLRLYLAVQEAVAWTGEPPLPDVDTLEDAMRRADSEPLSGIQQALRWAAKKIVRLDQCPRPSRRSDRAYIEVQLFTVLRFAFLHDNEMLPMSLRKVRNPVTGEEKTVKTSGAAQDVLGRAYSFTELWEAHEEQRSARINSLPAGASRSKESALLTPGNVLRTKADEVRRTPARELPRRERNALNDFRAEIVAGYTSR